MHKLFCTTVSVDPCLTKYSLILIRISHIKAVINKMLAHTYLTCLAQRQFLSIHGVYYTPFNPRKTGVCEYLERRGGAVSAPLSIFNLEALNGLISNFVYSLGYI